MAIAVRHCVLGFLSLILLAACVAPQPVYREERREVVSAEDYFNAGMRDFRKGDYENAIDNFESAQKIKPDYVEAEYYMGQSYEQLRKFDKAEHEYRECIAINSQYLPAREALGLLLFAAGRYQEAETELDVAVRLRTVLPEVYYARGEIYRMLKECRKAMDAYGEALRLNPSYRAARDGLDWAEGACGRATTQEKKPRVEKTFKGGGKAINPEDF